jgi:hypothetical protein
MEETIVWYRPVWRSPLSGKKCFVQSPFAMTGGLVFGDFVHHPDSIIGNCSS